MKPLFFTAVLALMLAAAGLTYKLNSPPPRPASGSRLAVADLASQRLPAVKATPMTDALVPPPLEGAQAQAAVAHNLFHPSRRPPETEEPLVNLSVDGPPAASETYTLVSVAQIGTRAVASIAVLAAPTEAQAATAPARGRPSLPQGRKAPGAATKAKAERALYQIGDKVGSTGYVLDVIELNRVILKRGTETKELLIDAKSDESAARRESAAKAAPKSAAPVASAMIRTLAEPSASSTSAAPNAATPRTNAAAATAAARSNAAAVSAQSAATQNGGDSVAPTTGVVNASAETSAPPGVTAGRASRQSREAADNADTSMPTDENGEVFVMPPGGLPPPPPPGGLTRPSLP